MPNNGGGGHLAAINRNKSRIKSLETRHSNPLIVEVTEKASFGTFVAGVCTVVDFTHYIMRAQVDMGTDRLTGKNFKISGDGSFATLLTTNSATAMISSNGDGYIDLRDLLLNNRGGPMINAELGAVKNVSVLFLDGVRFNGDNVSSPGTGVGTLGTIDGADVVIIQDCFFLECYDGLKLDGVIQEFTFINSNVTSRTTAPAFTGIEVLAGATLDIAVLTDPRFVTRSVADRCLKLHTSATYTSPFQLRGGTIRGPGTFVGTGHQKTDKEFFATGATGTTAPVNSNMFGSGSIVSNSVETVIVSDNTPVPIGSGAPTHTVFTQGAGTERWELIGATTQVQKFKYKGFRTQTFTVDLHTRVDKGGGGSVLVELSILLNDVVVPGSVTVTDVDTRGTGCFSTDTFEIEPDDEITLEIANNTSSANLIVNSASLRIYLLS